VFNNDKAELFILHDLFLPAYPLCIEWMDFNPTAPKSDGNFAALGYTTPEIDIWDMNLSGSLEPAVRLGAKKGSNLRHTDAVIDLSWNTNCK